jgi:hypothetical protein
VNTFLKQKIYIAKRTDLCLDLNINPLVCTIGWVDIGTLARIPLNVVAYLSKSMVPKEAEFYAGFKNISYFSDQNAPIKSYSKKYRFW